MWFIIESNKRKTWFLLFSLVSLLVIFGALIGLYIDPESFDGLIAGIIISTFFAIVIIFWTRIESSKIFLNQLNAYPLEDDSIPVVKNVVEEMAISANLGFVPKIYIVPSKVPNAFAVGINSKNSAIALSVGLLSLLNRDELQGVVAHEISHIKNKDTLYLMYAGIIFGAIVMLSEIIIRGGLNRRMNNSSKNGAGIVALLIIIVLSILAPILSKILYFTISRKREYLADACSAQFTRYPLSLASALKKISSYDTEKIEKDEITKDKVISTMYIHNYLMNDKENFLDGLFSTHPPIEKRIEILEKMAGSDIKDYSKTYNDVFKGKVLIPKEKLDKIKF